MAKFTIYFKDKPIQSYIFDSGVIHIGRDDSNDLVIDSLAVAPAHAVVIIKADSCFIKQLNNDHPLVINNENTKDSLLKNNDTITIGKHASIYSTTESIAPAKNDSAASRDVESLNGKLEESINFPDAKLQILDGAHIGRILPLKKSMTRFGHAGTDTAIIAKRKEGYFISSLDNNANILINNKPLTDKTIQLQTNDIVFIDNISMQFF